MNTNDPLWDGFAVYFFIIGVILLLAGIGLGALVYVIFFA